MKAIVYMEYGGPDVLQIKDVKKPEPGPHEVLIRIHASVVTPADCAFRQGRPRVVRFITGLFKPGLIPGVELAGEVEAVGREVTLFRTGDAVFGADPTGCGAHAEYKCLSEQGALALKPPGLRWGEAAALADGGLAALTFLRDRAKVRPGQTLLINGASGSVGTAAVQLARYFGAEVTGVCSGANVERVRSLGAHRVIDYTKEDFTRGGQTWDIILDAAGRSSFARCRGSLKPGGVYLCPVLSLNVALKMLWTSLRGGKKAVFPTSRHSPENLRFLAELAEAGRLNMVIDRSYRLEEIAEAHRYVQTGHKKGNVVIPVAPGGDE